MERPVTVVALSVREVRALVHRFQVDEPATREYTSYRVNVPPPSWARVSGVQLTATFVLPATAARSDTANAAVAGVSAVDADEAVPVPAELIAATVTVYCVPFTRPEIVHGEVEQAVVETTVPAPVGVATRR